MYRGIGAKEKRGSISRRAHTKRVDRDLLMFSRELLYLKWFSATWQELLSTVGLRIGNVAPVSRSTDRDSFPICRVVSLSPLRERLGRTSVVPQSAATGN